MPGILIELLIVFTSPSMWMLGKCM